MDCDDAWKDAITFWKDEVKGQSNLGLSGAVGLFLNAATSSQCGILTATSNCGETKQCGGYQNTRSGAGAWKVWNSLIYIHDIYQSYHDALFDAAAAAIDPALQDFESNFSPVPPTEDNTSLLLLLDIITVGISAAAAPFFNNFLSKLPYFISHENTFNNVKDLTMMMIGQSTTIAKDLLSTKSNEWTGESQAKFSNYLSQTIIG